LLEKIYFGLGMSTGFGKCIYLMRIICRKIET